MTHPLTSVPQNVLRKDPDLASMINNNIESSFCEDSSLSAIKKISVDSLCLQPFQSLICQPSLSERVWSTAFISSKISREALSISPARDQKLAPWGSPISHWPTTTVISTSRYDLIIALCSNSLTIISPALTQSPHHRPATHGTLPARRAL